MKKRRISHPQKRILESELFIEDTPLNNVYMEISFLPGSEKRLKEIIKYLIHNTPDLNIRFSLEVDGEISQYVGEPNDSLIEMIRLENESPEEIFEKVRDLATKAFRKVFDEPLYRFYLIDRGDSLRLLMVTHHAICDGGSINLLAAKISELFDQNDRESWTPLESEAFSYLEVEGNYLSSPQMESDRAFWQDYLAELEEFPEKKNDPQSYWGDYLFLEIPEDLKNRLTDYLKSFKKPVSPFSFMLALTGLYFGRINNQTRSLTAMGYANRNHGPALASSLGMYVSTVPVKQVFEAGQSFESFLTSSKQAMKEALSHSQYPLDLLMGELPEEVSGKLMDVVLVSNSTPKSQQLMQYYPMKTSIGGVTIRVNPFKDDQDGLQQIFIEYKKSVYEKSRIEEMARAFVYLIEQILENPLIACDRIQVVSKEEEKKLFEIFNDTKKPVGDSVVAMFKEAAGKNPDQLAVIYNEVALSYSQVDQITNKIAAKLLKEGLKKEEPVGVMIDRSEYMVLFPLAVLKAGGAYMPLDHTFPTERLDYMLKDAGVTTILSEDTKVEDHLPDFKGKIFKKEELDAWEEVKELKVELPQKNQKFVVLYTSGSTGKPKGCVLEHGNLANFCSWFKDYYKLTPEDRGGAYASFGFDAHMMDIYPYITCGACVCIIPAEIRLDFIKLNEYYEKNQVNYAFMTTQLGRQFVQEIDNRSLKALTIGGEKLPSIKLPTYDLFHAYGPTECTIFTTTRKFKTEHDCLLIGKPISNYQLFVLDKNLQPLPIGAVGELCIGGAGVGRGYLNREDLNQEKYINWRGQRIYLSGDYVKWLENGEIEFVGRIDGQVKLRGLRIELGEVESKLAAYPGILSSCVVVKEIGGNEHLCAYYVAPNEIDQEEMKRFLAEDLASFMIPTAFLHLDSLPLTPNGKVNRKALPQPQIVHGEIVPPQNQVQQQIFKVIADIVGSDKFGITDDLFTVGLTSLMGIKVAVRLHNLLGVDIKTTDIIQGKTIQAIEKLIQNADRQELVKAEKQADYPLTRNQWGIYLDSQKDPQALQYNIPTEIKLSKEIDLVRLESCLKACIDRHAYIKTCLTESFGEIRQLRNDEAQAVVEVKKLRQDQMAAYKSKFVQAFDLFKGLLYRIEIIETEDKIYILSDFHHIICDGASLQIFYRDLAALYDGREVETESYTAFDQAVAEENYQSSDDFAKDKAYFRNRIKSQMTKLEADKKGSPGGLIKRVRSGIDQEKVDTFAKKLGVAPSSIFLSALAYALYRFTRAQTIAFTAISNGRSQACNSENMGMFVKTLPLFFEMKEASSIEAFIKNNQAQFFETLKHENYPLTEIVKNYQIQPHINFAYQAGVLENLKIGEESLEIEEIGVQKAKFELSVHINLNDDGYQIESQYDEALYSRELIERLNEGIKRVVEVFIDNRDKNVAEISLLSKTDREKLAAFNPSQEKRSRLTVAAAFEKTVFDHGGEPAVIAADRNLSYQELDQESNRIASALLKMGIGSGDKIGFMLKRDSRLQVTMLGILKTGAAFIPIDPEYPVKRIKNIVEDSMARLVITDGQESQLEAQTIAFDTLLEAGDRATVKVQIEPDDLCYIIFTSGSTGRPKGVMLKQKGLVNYISPSENNTFAKGLVDSCQVLVSITTVSFDVFLKENMTALLNGKTLVLADENQVNDPTQLAKLMVETQVDGFSATPSRMLQYLESKDFEEAVGRLNFIVCGGEKFPPGLFTRLSRITKARIFNTYGPTEITISSNAKELKNEIITIGKPLSNVVEYICDPDGNLLPIGVVGELYIGGMGVGRGYLNNPEQTRKAFIDYEGQRVYKTGDYAKWTDDGEVIILGRMDGQIKLRGLRIELGEIENAMLEYPGLTQAVVDVKELQGSQFLCAYYTGAGIIAQDELIEHLKLYLTRYMIPSFFSQMDNLPMNVNGKIDKKALPLPQKATTHDYAQPLNKMEEKVCGVFAQTLDLKQVGRNDNFFEIGGTSLLATRLTVKAANAGLKIAYADVFKYQTPEKMSQFLIDSGQEGAESGCRQEAVKNYDYSEIDELLKSNAMAYLSEIEHLDEEKLGNILLTGATGYLGIHILREYLRDYQGTAYCVVRPKGNLSGEMRLKNMLMFYFESDFEEEFGKRIIPVEGEITDINSIENFKQYPIHTVINCAANVKHFAVGSEIEKINVGGVRGLIDLCKDMKARLIQVSTHSIAGTSINKMPPKGTLLKESELFIGQDLENKYVNSKFMAERYVLQSVVEGLDAKIMRVGNLMARNSDGEFQVNFNSNAFMGRLRAYKLIGAFPYSGMEENVEFAPIDSTAAAILNLSQTPKQFRVFHPYNNHTVTMGDVIYSMCDYGFEITLVEDDVFKEKLDLAMNDDRLNKYLSGIIAYSNTRENVPMSYLGSEQRFTTNMLFRRKYKWPLTTDTYLKKMIKAIDGLGFFGV